MRTTIDGAGRVVIPKALRERAGLTAGEVDIEVDGDGLHLSAVSSAPTTEIDGELFVASSGSRVTAGQVRDLRLTDQR